MQSSGRSRYQTWFAEHIRREASIRTGAIGMITSPIQAEYILVTEQAEAIIARELSPDQYWPQRAARELRPPISWPVQYLRAASETSQARSAVDLKNLESRFESNQKGAFSTKPPENAVVCASRAGPLYRGIQSPAQAFRTNTSTKTESTAASPPPK